MICCKKSSLALVSSFKRPLIIYVLPQPAFPTKSGE